MTKNQIEKIKSETKDLDLTASLLNKLEGYYYYFNCHAKQKNKLHIFNCGHCCYGSGKHTEAQKGEKGVWIGPFDSDTTADKILLEKLHIIKIAHCSCVKKNKTEVKFTKIRN
jgi:hypothetical protein